jgi:RND family efflux transporter MFP subunit
VRSIVASGWFLVVFLASVVAGGCEQHKPAAAAKGPPEVFVSAPVSKEITDYEEFSGRLEANQSIVIRARVTGYLLKVHFKEGGLVKKGDLLFEIDPPLYEATLARDQGNLKKAEAQLHQATVDWMRIKQMRRGIDISQEEFNKFESAHLLAEAEIKVAKANLKIAQVNMDYTKVCAPISGRISKTAIDPGNLVKADDTVLTSIGDSDPIEAYFDVDERTVVRIVHLMHEGVIPKEVSGVPVEMGLADEESRPHKGVIDFTDNYVDSSTGTLRVRGVFPNPHELLVPGMFARVRLPIGKPQQVILIAEKALVTDQGQKFVYVVKDENEIEHEGKVEYRAVKIGRLHEGLRVVKEGLNPNEKVVVSGLQRVRPDIKVKFKDVAMPISVAQGAISDPQSAVSSQPPTVSQSPPAAGAKHPKGHREKGKGH